MFNLGTTEIVIILIVALLLLGPQQLPEVGKFVGKALRDFRGMSGEVTRALDLDGHNDYDRVGRGASFEYGYGDKTGYGHEPDTDTKAFAYSAPTDGTPVAAIGGVAEGDVAHTAGDAVPVGDEPDQPHTAIGAQVYAEPTTPAPTAPAA